MTAEKRSIQNATDVQALSDSELRVSGYALKFDTISQDLGGFYETIPASAISKVDLSDVRLLINHDPNKVMARTKSGTMTLTKDDTGLYFEAALPNTVEGLSIYESLKRGDIDGCSFEMDVVSDEWSRDLTTNVYIRTIEEIAELREISIVTFPAYLSSEAGLATAQRSLKQYQDYEKDLLTTQILIELERMEEP
ncbi:HK97 family phage prohead protease [Listeria monocytogenes]|uniref:HK97 family phage prohead protease n=1 Tax=Listeria monocytogenes TaxID=1639 RepID=UPI003F9ABD04